MKHAARVGLLVVLFVAMLFGAYAVLGRSLFAPKVKTYFAEMPDAGGVGIGTPVLMAGVPIGTVKKIELASPTQARLTLEIEEKVGIPVGSAALVPGSLIGIGDTALSLVPGAGPGLLPAGSVLPGRKASAFEGLIPDVAPTLKEVEKTLAATRKLLEDRTLRTSIDTLLATSNQTAAQFGSLAGRIDDLVVQNQGQVSQTLRVAEASLVDIQKVTSSIAKLVDEGKIQDNTIAILEQLRQTAKRADDLVVSMNKLANDPELIGPAKASAANLEAMTKTGTQIANDGKLITENGIKISENAIILSEKANEIATKASALADRIATVLEKVERFFDRGPSTGSLEKLETRVELFRETKPDRWRTDLDATYPISGGALRFGLYDAFEGNKVTVQYQRPLNSKLSYRYGVYASKIGVGVDYEPAPRVGLRGELWDINALQLDLRARYEIGNGLYTWLGMDSVFDRNAPTIGVGIRR
jgi:phospholipid/cholesterol/gamma-HCH transport system substrate-binding protein